jgi:hypothetical protein
MSYFYMVNYSMLFQMFLLYNYLLSLYFILKVLGYGEDMELYYNCD